MVKLLSKGFEELGSFAAEQLSLKLSSKLGIVKLAEPKSKLAAQIVEKQLSIYLIQRSRALVKKMDALRILDYKYSSKFLIYDPILALMDAEQIAYIIPILKIYDVRYFKEEYLPPLAAHHFVVIRHLVSDGYTVKLGKDYVVF